VFGFSFGEFVMICVVALVFVGPQKLPGVLRTLGEWIRKARSMVYDMRAQSGIDDLLRAEGLHGGMSELRSLMRGGHAPPYVPPPAPEVTPSEATSPPSPSPYYHEPMFGCVDIDPTKEYPPEGPDAYGALPDDLFDVPVTQAVAPPEPGPTAGVPPATESAPDESAPPAQSAPAA
jgi:sec-independent protein translocase protein TatB